MHSSKWLYSAVVRIAKLFLLFEVERIITQSQLIYSSVKADNVLYKTTLLYVDLIVL